MTRRTYLVWFRGRFIGRVWASSAETAAHAFGARPGDLKVRPEHELALDERVEADSPLRA